jgi:hypothetical protein
VLLFWPQGDGSVTSRALAAIGDGPVMHVVMSAPSGVRDINLQTGVRQPEWNVTTEIWADEQLTRFHLVVRYLDKTAIDVLWPEDKAKGVTVGSVDPAFAALWTGYRESLRDGTARRIGEGDEFGHHVYWLRFPVAGQPSPLEVAVDTATFKPIVFRSYSLPGGAPTDEHILTAESIGFDPSDFTRTGPNPGTGGYSTSSGSLSATSGEQRTTVPPGWLTAGSRADGAALSDVVPQTVTTADKRTLHGYELVYGPLDHALAAADATTVDELAQPDNSGGWRQIPAGSVRIQRAQSSIGGKARQVWIGMLVKDGLYLTITSSHGENAVVAIARALHRAR